jgi:RimJ/RimL family protein N-acetyltransferase
VDGVVALRAADAGVRTDAGPWLLPGVARRGEVIWFRVEHRTRADLVGVAALVRRARASFEEVGYAPVAAAGGRGFARSARRLLARTAFEGLGLSRLETRIGGRDDLIVAALRKVGFTCVGRHREDRSVWSLVRGDAQ